MGAALALVVLPLAVAWACVPAAAISFDRSVWEYRASDQVTVLGNSFAPSTPVVLTIDPPSGPRETVGNGVSTDSSGNFRDSFTLPASAAPGTYVLVATANTTAVDGHGRTYVARASFTVVPPPGTEPPAVQTGPSWSGLTASGTTLSTGTATTAPPTVSSYALTNNPFVMGGGSTPTFGTAASKKHQKGTTFKYTLSEAATVKIVISHRSSGRQEGRQCVAPTRELRKAKKCTLLGTKGTLTRSSKAGANSIAFSGRIGSKALSPGTYQATLTAADNAKNTSKPKSISFTIVKR